MKLKALIISTGSLLLFSATATAEIIGGGGDSGGCVMGPDRGFDPMFPLLVLFAVVYLIRRRVKTRVK